MVLGLSPMAHGSLLLSHWLVAHGSQLMDHVHGFWLTAHVPRQQPTIVFEMECVGTRGGRGWSWRRPIFSNVLGIPGVEGDGVGAGIVTSWARVPDAYHAERMI